MTIDRRLLLTAGGAAALAGALPAAAQTRAPAAASPADAALTRLTDRLVEQGLQESPERATSLGLDVGARAALRGRTGDGSLAAKARQTAQRERDIAELRTIDRSRLSPANRITRDTLDFQLTERQRQAKFPYGGTFSAYTLTQQAGAYGDTPDFLENQQPLKTAADADAWLSRLEGYAVALDQDTERFLAEVEAGAIPPDFVLDTTAGQLRKQRATPAAEASGVRGLATKAAAAGLPASYGARAAAIFAERVVPALDRQLAAVERVRPRASHDAGIWKARDGEAYYAAKLKWYTTTDLTPDQVHTLGREQVADLTARMDAVLKGLGYTQGTVLARLQALNVEPAQLYPNTDAGRAELLASLNGQIAEMDRRLPRAFNRLPRAKVEVRRVPVDIQDGSANGYYQSPSLDGARPGAFYINLKSTTDWPKWALPTLTYHEATPGHHLQNALKLEDPTLSLYQRAFTGFSAYGEGWGLYSEQVADELGMYDAYPLGRVGFLQAYLYRAVRLVVDTGMHAKRWSREKSLQYMIENTGQAAPRLGREIDRYAANPAQACSYKIGQTEILRLREATRRRLGARFDIKAFHDVVLGTGSVPLTVLERTVNDWAAAA